MSGNRQVFTNPTYNELWKPELGPATPWGMSVAPGQKNILTGFVQDEAINDYLFEQQHHLFQTTGEAIHPGERNKIVRSAGTGCNHLAQHVDEKKRKVSPVSSQDTTSTQPEAQVPAADPSAQETTPMEEVKTSFKLR